jgi:hypothetical protein
MSLGHSDVLTETVQSHEGATTDTQCPPPASPSSSATPALTNSRNSQGTISSIDSAASAPLRFSTPNVAPPLGQGHAAAANGRVPPLVIPHQAPQSQQVPYSPYTRPSYHPFYMLSTQRDFADYSYQYGPISPTHTTLSATLYSPTIGHQNPVHGTQSTMYYSDQYSVPAGRPVHSYYYSPPVPYASGLPAHPTTRVNVSTMAPTRKQASAVRVVRRQCILLTPPFRALFPLLHRIIALFRSMCRSSRLL